MKITIYNEQTALAIDESRLSALVSSFLKWKKVTTDEVIIHLVDEKRMGEVHGTHFGDSAPTDCMTFPLDEEVLGEIFVCPAVACENCETYETNPLEETSLYVIHGLLHLLGFKDGTDTEKEEMRSEEKEALTFLKNQNHLL